MEQLLMTGQVADPLAGYHGGDTDVGGRAMLSWLEAEARGRRKRDQRPVIAP